MKPSERDFVLYLMDIELSIQRVLEYTNNQDFDSFDKDYKTIDAVVRNFEVIGEASKNVPVSIKAKYTNVPWEEMYKMRNKISHEYFGIDHKILWRIIKNNLPDNLKSVKEILTNEQS